MRDERQLASFRTLGVDVARQEGIYLDGYTFGHFAIDRTFDSGETITVAGLSVETVSVRGHAPDHVAYLSTLNGATACFVGDAVAPDGSISLLNVPGSSLADYRADIDGLDDRDIDRLLPGTECRCSQTGRRRSTTPGRRCEEC